MLIRLYDWFHTHKAWFWVALVSTTLVMAGFALKVNYIEDITSIFPNDEKENGGNDAFDNLKVMDKLVFMISAADTTAESDPYALIDAGYALADELQAIVDAGYLSDYMDCVDASTVNRSADFVYDKLPVYLTEADYARIDSLLTDESIDAAVAECYSLLSSPAGMIVGKIKMKDPLGLGTPLMQGFQDFNTQSEYEMFSDHIFSSDMETMLMFANPANSMGSTGVNDELTTMVENACAKVAEDCSVKVEYFGGPCVAAYNARVVKHDTILTVTIALLVIILVIFLSFRSKAAIPLIMLPIVYGALFALALIFFIQGSVSAIAVGAGAAVMGVALSYSIHVISHSNHTSDPHQIIEELAYPLTLGSFTTIGAFAALIFTHSPLLHDFGLFASLTLIGTTVFCLVFLPHFLKTDSTKAKSRTLVFIEKFLAYPLDRKKWFLAGLAVLTIVCCFFCGKVGFDSDMNNLCYFPDHLKQAEEKLVAISGDDSNQTFLVTVADNLDDACLKYDSMGSTIDSLVAAGAISQYVSARTYIIPSEVQKERIERWNEFWEGRREEVIAKVNKAAGRKGFKDGAFASFENLLSKEYEVCSYEPEMIADMPLLADWVENIDGKAVIVSRMTIDADKGEVYKAVSHTGGAAIADRGYFTNKMVSGINDDFNYILFVSSLIVFLALLISYGKIEYALLSFLPMAIGWVIILGLMAIFKIEFNIVSIILATFIFGIGDDFSIFIMDGLMGKYRDGSDILSSHKTAIFFSAFTTLVGIGVLVLAKHPAMRSMATISVLGILTVLIVEFTVQPVLFRFLVQRPVKKGVYPVDLACFFNAIEIWITLGTIFIVADLIAGLLCITPLPKKWKKKFFHQVTYISCKVFCKFLTPGEKFRKIDYDKHILDKPAVIIANHQSLVDVILIYALTPKVVSVTKKSFWNNPLFGPVIRYSECYCADGGDGGELPESLAQKLREGYSVIVFPEGTRSRDGKVHRFHKGAFKFAAEHGFDLLPIVYRGDNYVCPKGQSFLCRPAVSIQKFYPRVSGTDERFGSTDRERAKAWKQWFVNELEAVESEYGRATNREYKKLLRSNYLYKGSDLWRQVRRDCRRNNYWDALDRQVPRNADIVELGCGIGERALLLGMLSRGRQITGVDASEENIRIAQNCYLAKDNIRFECIDPRAWELREADVYILDGSLRTDTELAERCKAMLRPGGTLIYI